MIQPKSITVVLALTGSLWAAAVTTVPWNGHTGAASFTYDDGRPSQFSDLMPQLDKTGIKATFFLANNFYSFPTRKDDWIAVGKKGHELANHSGNHNSPTAANVKDMALILRGLDPSVDGVTYAYPNCTVVEGDASGENFMARGCGQVDYAWGTEPSKWMNVQGLILSNNVITPAITQLNKAKSSNSWVVTIVHDVTGTPDQYSLTPANNQTMLDQAVTNKLWIAPYATVGAYYMAHFTMDKVTPTTTADGWKLSWTLPSPKLPKSIKLRVKLDAATFGSDFTVRQAGTNLTKESDGTYVIEFTKLSMDVVKSTSLRRPEADAPWQWGVVRTGASIRLPGLAPAFYHWEFRDAQGGLLSSGARSLDAESLVPVEGYGRKGIWMRLWSEGSSRPWVIRIPPVM